MLNFFLILILFTCRRQNLAALGSELCSSCKHLKESLGIRLVRNAERNPDLSRKQVKNMSRVEMEERLKQQSKDLKRAGINMARMKKRLTVSISPLLNL